MRRARLAAALWLWPVAGIAYQGGPVASPGRVAGRVLLRGNPPAAAPLPVTRDREVCGASVPDERLRVAEDGGIANVVVSIDGIETGRPIDPAARGHLEHLGCLLRPHVQALAVGQVLEVRNADPVAHATRAVLNGEETVFSVNLPIQNQVVLQRMKRPSVLHLESEAGRDWMSAYVLVFDHPYAAVTGSDGAFAIDDLPPGRYRLRAWHETLGVEFSEVTVEAGAAARIDFLMRLR